jgi:hypothetical protein
VKRLAAPARRDRELLAQAVRPVGLLRRLANDAGPRFLFAIAVAAAVAGGIIAFG